MKYPDLLRREASNLVQSRSLSEAITFGFAQGVEEDRLLKLSAPDIGPTTFRQESFAADLFVDELVKGSFPLIVDGKRLESPQGPFRRALLAPPSDLQDTGFRREIFTELSSRAERRSQLNSAYLSIRAFRDALTGVDHVKGRSVGVRRRIDILFNLSRALEDLLSATGASTSGLERIATWVEGVQASKEYQSLAHLLQFEDGRTVLETRLQVGYDGSLRRFELTRSSEVSHRAFPRGPLTRFVRRLISLVKGYRFSEEDVMSQLLDQVFSDLEPVVVALLGLSLQLEFYLRGLAFSDLCKKKGLETSFATVLPKGGPARERRLLGVFNPWLAAKSDIKVVPCDLAEANACCTMIVTGPNSGGKTRLMQTLAVVQLLAQGGLPVPARQAVVVEVEQLFLSLIEQADADQREGRLGLELMRIREVFESSGPNSLIIMDELCSGTNPSEGERIFEMVLELLAELGPQVLITTHFLDFAHRLQSSEENCLKFLQVELSERELPTYQFVPGVAGTSLARNTAARLGVTRDELRSLILDHMEESGRER